MTEPLFNAEEIARIDLSKATSGKLEQRPIAEASAAPTAYSKMTNRQKKSMIDLYIDQAIRVGFTNLPPDKRALFNSHMQRARLLIDQL